MSRVCPNPLKATITVLGLAVLLCSASVALAFPETPTSGATVTIEDFSDVVTPLDGGFDDFSGNLGAINGKYVAQMAPVCDPTGGGTGCRLRFGWNFGAESEAYTGLFLSIFGLSDTVVTLTASSRRPWHSPNTPWTWMTSTALSGRRPACRTRTRPPVLPSPTTWPSRSRCAGN